MQPEPGERRQGLPPDGDRLAFVDTARAVAVVMMLQGHFTAVSLVERVRDLEDPAYFAHAYLRGLTAPLFLTVSGMVFAYFLEAGRGRNLLGARLRRGLVRGALLVALGYALHLRLAAFFRPDPSALKWLLSVHVLHVIGVGLWLITGLSWSLQRAGAWLRAGLFALTGTALFAVTSAVRSADFTSLPVALQNYLVTTHGSQFVLLPWLGYMLFGAVLGVAVGRLGHAPLRLRVLGLVTFSLGGALVLRATPWVFHVYRGLDPEGRSWFPTASHIWLTRLGWVLGLLGTLVAAEPWLRRQSPGWLRRLGQQTLFVYVVHAIVLYGAVTGFGLYSMVRRSLSPTLAALLAAAFVAVHVALVELRRAWLHGPWPRLRRRLSDLRPRAEVALERDPPRAS